MKFKNLFFIIYTLLILSTFNIKSETLDGRTNIIYDSHNHIFQDANKNYIYGFVQLDKGFTLTAASKSNLPSGLYFDGCIPLSGGIDLRETNTLTLLKDIFFDNSVTFSSGGNIYGYDKAIILNGDLSIPANIVLHFNGRLSINGNGHTLSIGENSQLFIDANTTLTLKNIVIKNNKNFTDNPCVNCAANNSILALDNVILNPINDFYFNRGSIFFHNDVAFTGTSVFIYRSCQPSFITSGGILYFDIETTFDFRPSTTGTPGLLAKDLLIMQDASSQLYLDGCSLKTTMTGLRLTKGQLIFDNKISITSAAQLQLKSTKICTNQYLGEFARSVNWSPNGRYLAVAGLYGTTDLIIYYFNGSTLTQITSKDFGSLAISVNWSPDGRYLAVGGNNSLTDVIIYSFDGSNLTQITSQSFRTLASSVNWSPDGQYLAVTGTYLATDVIIYSFDGSTLTQIASKDFGNYASSVNWSPDGRYLAVGGANGSTDLIIYSFDGSTLNQITTQDFGTEAYSVNWSPDGRYLAVGGANGSTDLIIYSFDGLTLTQIITQDFGTEAYSVNWSPDGRYLAVGGYNAPKHLIIYSFDGSTLNQVTTQSFGNHARSVNWSPDSKYLAVGGSGTSYDVIIYELNYGPETQTQAISNSIIFGNSALGSNYDLNIKLLSAAKLEVDGKILYDNLN